MQISEHDWKIFRKKIPEWQELYMERLTADYITLLQSDKKRLLNSGNLKNVSSRIRNLPVY